MDHRHELIPDLDIRQAARRTGRELVPDHEHGTDRRRGYRRHGSPAHPSVDPAGPCPHSAPAKVQLNATHSK
jgi:hypothetical protein